MIKYLLVFLSISAYAGDNTINIEQIGDNNSITISQDGSGHTATVELGKTTAGSGNVITIDQRDVPQTAIVEIKTGINNGVNILQQGAGNHIAAIQNFIGSGNNISVDQGGAGNHTFTVSNYSSNTNNGNTITATQNGGLGADKTFNLLLNGVTGAGVTVTQTNPTQANQGSMTIQCNPCGSYSYIRQ
jgi:hypothetical protein